MSILKPFSRHNNSATVVYLSLFYCRKYRWETLCSKHTFIIIFICFCSHCICALYEVSLGHAVLISFNMCVFMGILYFFSHINLWFWPNRDYFRKEVQRKNIVVRTLNVITWKDAVKQLWPLTSMQPHENFLHRKLWQDLEHRFDFRLQ